MRALLIVLLCAVPLTAQTRESIEVQVMELDVAVLDRTGRAVEGLERGDFEVRIGRRVEPIKNFFAVRGGIVLEDATPAAARASEAVTRTETTIPTSLVIFIDETHLRHGSRKRALEALQRYVAANVGPLTTATLIRYNKHFDVRTRPTDRPGYILAELEKLSRETSLGDENDREREQMIKEIDLILSGSRGAGVAGESPDTIFYRIEKMAERRTGDVDRALAALEGAIELASAFNGRRVLLYVSDGVPQQPGAELIEYWETALRSAPEQVWRNEAARLDSSRIMRFDRTQQFQRVARTAQRAGVSIFAFDAVGLRGYEGRTMEFEATSGRINTMLMHASLRGGLEFMANETGGRYIGNENNLDRALEKMSEQFTTYYSIGVKPRTGDIRVSVKNRPELRVIASRRRPARTRDEQLEQNVRTRLYTRTAENPLNATIGVSAPTRINDQCVVSVKLDLAQPKVMTPEAVEVHLVMLNERNDESDVRRVTVPFESGRVAHTMTLRVQPQHHVLSIAVANPLSGEASYLQGEVDGRKCR